MAKVICYGEDARKALQAGIDKLSASVISTDRSISPTRTGG